ncbi:MAG TPA: endolytic transglycosylase MltG [Candidatus Saccharimonadales bacterium]|nr:endolytic transglycosylase MltG [Candidatus Saccharimonadales bacterium]
MSNLPAPMLITKKQPRWFTRPLTIIIAAAIIVAIGTVGGVLYMNHWYKASLKPLSSEQQRIRVTISEGADAGQIGKLLQGKGVIRSARSFSRYVDNTHNKERLQAGTYLFSPSESVQTIVDMLANGKVDTFNLTLVPGKRLDQIKASLVKAGFDETQVATALAAKYDSPLLADKPASADLEGYIFPDTYQLNSETTPSQFFEIALANLYKRVQDEGLIDKLHQRGLNLHQAFTLASIVQQEASNADDQRMVAQVFLSRLQQNMMLGSDVTAFYASYKAGIANNISINSPYNTRVNKGLPPGPIGNFNLSALEAVANPSNTDYLFFVAGDDGKIYYSHTQAEHEQLTKEYCTKLCQ